MCMLGTPREGDFCSLINSFLGFKVPLREIIKLDCKCTTTTKKAIHIYDDKCWEYEWIFIKCSINFKTASSSYCFLLSYLCVCHKKCLNFEAHVLEILSWFYWRQLKKNKIDTENRDMWQRQMSEEMMRSRLWTRC